MYAFHRVIESSYKDAHTHKSAYICEYLCTSLVLSTETNVQYLSPRSSLKYGIYVSKKELPKASQEG